MPIGLTEFGREALTKLLRLHQLSWLVPADNQSFNKKIEQKYQKLKAANLAALGPLIESQRAHGQNLEDIITFEWEKDGGTNANYTAALEKFVAESVLSSCVDTYHWYLRRVFETALIADRSRINSWAKTLDLSPKRVNLITTASDLRSAISSVFRGSEEPFRKLAHEFLGVPDLDVIPQAVVVRNCLVHELGIDRVGNVAKAIAAGNSLGIELEDGRVTVSAGAAYAISERFVADVSIMDQALANILSLPTDTAPLPSFKREYS